MSISILRELSDEQKKESLIKASIFVLSESSNQVRINIYTSLVVQSLYLLTKENIKATPSDIQFHIKEQFFGIELNIEQINQTLAILVSKQEVSIIEEAYSISDNKVVEIEESEKLKILRNDKVEELLYLSIESFYGTELTVEQRMIAEDTFFTFITYYLSNRIGKISGLVTKGELKRIRTTPISNQLNEIMRGIVNRTFKSSLKKGILELFIHPSDEFINFLFNLEKNIFCFEILNLDPECKTLQIKAFQQKRLFLDTNVLMSLVCSSNKLHNSVKKLIKNTLKLGTKIFVTKRTIKEYNHVLETTLTNYELLKAPAWLYPKIGDSFIRSYADDYKLDNTLKWNNYVSASFNLENALQKYDIEIYEEDHDDIYKNVYFDELIEEVISCCEKRRRRKKRLEVAEHDAYHILLIKTLRNNAKPSLIGPRDWFLSADTTLPCTDRMVSKYFEFQDVSTPIMISSLWNDLITPFLSNIDNELSLKEAFRSFLSSQFAPIVEYIDINTILSVQGDWLGYEWLKSEEIEGILHKKFVVDYASNLRKAHSVGDRILEDQLRANFLEEFNKLLGISSQRKFEQMKKESEEVQRTAKEETDNLREELETEISFSHRWRTRSGIAGISLLIAGLFLSFFMVANNKIDVVTAAFCIAFIAFGAYLFVLTVRPEQVKANAHLGVKI